LPGQHRLGRSDGFASLRDKALVEARRSMTDWNQHDRLSVFASSHSATAWVP
jgi:hypothetical protein